MARQPLKDIANLEIVASGFRKNPHIVVCDEHGLQAKLMTAVKDGPNGYTKRYYICSHETPCDFFQPSTQIAQDIHPIQEDSNSIVPTESSSHECSGNLPAQNATVATSTETGLEQALSKLKIEKLSSHIPEVVEKSQNVAVKKANFESIRIPRKQTNSTSTAQSAGQGKATSSNEPARLLAAPFKPAPLNQLQPQSTKFEMPPASTGRVAARLGPLASAALDEDLRACYDNLWRDPAPLDPPAGLAVELFPHQRASVAWMAAREAGPAPHGGILADDMGLGKTIQLIALILAAPPPARLATTAAGAATTLVVCPKSVLRQWAAEIGRAAPALRVYEYSGASRRGRRRHPASHPRHFPSSRTAQSHRSALLQDTKNSPLACAAFTSLPALRLGSESPPHPTTPPPHPPPPYHYV